MEKKYNHKDHEQKIYSLWEQSDSFKPNSDPLAETFTIIMPPPNANDPLHVGHAMFVAIEDIMIRYNRMLGKASLWVPGTDHAGIETQFVFEKKLAKQKQSRFDFDRKTLYQKIWNYVQENSDTAVTQIKQLGASADWSRFKFMLDPDIVDTVLHTFQQMASDNLVYRDLRLVNYCTHCGTAFSDLEVVYQDQTTPLYYIRYRQKNDPNKFIVIATTRPEPIFADTHIAVHPDNPQTKALINTQVLNPLTDAPMEVIADDFVDPDFGTGIVKLTPAHDHNDFEVAKRHNLPLNQAIDQQGKIMAVGGEFAGMKVKAAREAVVKKLEEKGLIEKVDFKYQNRVNSCYRCGRPLEPIPMAQFFIKVKPLVTPIIETLDQKQLKVIGAGHNKILRHWLENLKDWNISRQIVWGIQMPVWYEISDKTQATSNKKIQVTFINQQKETIRGLIGELLHDYSLEDIRSGLQSLQAPVDAKYIISLESPGENYLQETDTFDTWFSSAQWPFSTLLNTQSGDFDRFYPTQVMETGYDILPFWVMRMLMMGYYKTNTLPFSTVYMHGLIRDPNGQKMSKSKGNVINPLDVVDEYGADALRMALVIRSSAGLDKNVGIADFKAMRNLTNKIWNATRFVINANYQAKTDSSKIPTLSTNIQTDTLSDTKPNFTDYLNVISQDITKELDDYRIGNAAELVYNYFWHWYCDECIELNKQGYLSKSDLFTGLVVFLKLLHPFVPFVTETLYQHLKSNTVDPHLKKLVNQPLLISSSWPTK